MSGSYLSSAMAAAGCEAAYNTLTSAYPPGKTFTWQGVINRFCLVVKKNGGTFPPLDIFLHPKGIPTQYLVGLFSYTEDAQAEKIEKPSEFLLILKLDTTGPQFFCAHDEPANHPPDIQHLLQKLLPPALRLARIRETITQEVQAAGLSLEGHTLH